MVQREYRIRGARFSLLEGKLLVQYRSGTGVLLKLGIDGSPQPYVAAGPVFIEVDDGTGGQPKFDGTAEPAADDFGDVLTEVMFLGNAEAYIEGEFLVVTAAGTPVIAEGAARLPVTAGDLAGAGRLTWTSSFDSDGSPHPPLE